MTLKRRIRLLAGLLAVVTLLGLVTADTILSGVTLSLENKVILISLISALLGIDIAWDQIPITIGRSAGPAEGPDRNGGDRDD